MPCKKDELGKQYGVSSFQQSLYDDQMLGSF